MTPYGYRSDPAVPSFDDRAPIVVFDGHCVLCSEGVLLLLRLDRAARFKVTAVQQPVAQALYRHYGLDAEAFDTFMVLVDGMPQLKSDGVLAVGAQLGGGWRLLARLARFVPRRARDAVYDWVQRNRFRWFGRRADCLMPTPALRARFLEPETPTRPLAA